MPRDEIRLQRLTFFLTKDGITDQDRILPGRAEYDDYPVTIASGFLGMLYVRRSVSRLPDWLSLLLPHVEVRARDLGLTQASGAAVLLVQRGSRVFVLTFGGGRNLLADGVIDERFGLRTTLNAVDPTRLRSIDRKTFSEVHRHTREDVSREAGLEAFGINVEEDLLRGVTGSPGQDAPEQTMSGMDALTVSVRATLDGVPALLDRYLDLNARNDYKKTFPWVDNIAEVRDPDRVDRLFDTLADRIRDGETDRVWLAPPDLLSWTSIRGFSYRTARNAGEFPDLRLEDYLNDCRRTDTLDARHFETDRVICLPVEGGDEAPDWMVKACLCADLELDGSRFVLTDGKWFRIDSAFAAKALAAVEGLSTCEADLPDYNHNSEDHYNAKVVERSKGEFCLLHGPTKLVDTGTGRGRIEVCDVYTRARQFIHIKRYGGSRVLSHLFSQGVVSGQFFFSDRTFRRSVNAVLPDTHRITDPNRSVGHGEYEIAYVVIGPRGRPLRLPFFSVVNLKNASTLLSAQGFRVTFTPISNRRV
jgi:uncharacterized protein (TIGR04141 family)